MAGKFASGDKNIMDWFSSAFGEFPCLLHSRKARELNSIRVQVYGNHLKSNNKTKGDIGEKHSIKDCLSFNDDTNKGEVHTNEDSPQSGDDTKRDQGEVHTNQDSPKSGDETKGDQGELHTIQDSSKSGDDTKGDQGEVHNNQKSPKSGDETKGDQEEVHTTQDSSKFGDETEVYWGKKNDDIIDFTDTVDTNLPVYALLALKDEDAGSEAWLAVQKHPLSIVARVNFAYFMCNINKRERAEKQLAWLMKLKKGDPEFFSKLLEAEVSTKFNDFMNAAVSATKPVDSVAETLSAVTSHGNILALLTEDASLPPLLKEHRVLPYPQELQKFEEDMLKSREYVVTICKFFCQLLNSDVEIT